MNVPPPPPASSPPPPPSYPPPGAAAPSGYPATLTVDTPAKVANWRPLVHWLLAIPHLIIASLLGYVAQIAAFFAWLIVLSTGKMPEGLANFLAMSARYSIRSYAYAGFLHETYPPFDFTTTAADPGGHPVRVDFVPALENRNRLTVALRIIWAIPAMIVTAIIGIVAYICWIIAFFAVLFTGKWPEGLRSWVLKALRASVRLNAYLFLLTDEYPPLSFD
ncbi:MAG TPA: DUF4389 domain-containing protein [Ilumatobacter sp.]|nr:DUF4389 domain-containing protein [Ilumatobacter sp.]